MARKGSLTLFPSPIAQYGSLSTEDKNYLNACFENSNCDILVEDHKPARRRWISWGLDREAIEQFILFNEHTMEQSLTVHLQTLKQGKDLVLLSDGGLPGFCDPGAELIYRCHQSQINVHCRPFFNSVMLALVLSGLPHQQFFFSGFPPAKKEERESFFSKLVKNPQTIILMDTPYRLNQLVNEMAQYFPERMVFLGLELGNEEEELILDSARKIGSKFSGEKVKKEFVAVIGPQGFLGY